MGGRYGAGVSVSGGEETGTEASGGGGPVASVEEGGVLVVPVSVAAGGDPVVVVAGVVVPRGIVEEATDGSAVEETTSVVEEATGAFAVVSVVEGDVPEGVDGGGGADAPEGGVEFWIGADEWSVNVFASFIASAIQLNVMSVGAALFKIIENPFVLLFITR